jgi:hypothetical protein
VLGWRWRKKIQMSHRSWRTAPIPHYPYPIAFNPTNSMSNSPPSDVLTPKGWSELSQILDNQTQTFEIYDDYDYDDDFEVEQIVQSRSPSPYPFQFTFDE